MIHHESTYSQIVEQRPLIRPFQAKHWSDFSDTSSDESAREEGPLMKDQKEEELCESSCSVSGFIPSELWGEGQAGSPAAALEHGFSSRETAASRMLWLARRPPPLSGGMDH